MCTRERRKRQRWDTRQANTKPQQEQWGKSTNGWIQDDGNSQERRKRNVKRNNSMLLKTCKWKLILEKMRILDLVLIHPHACRPSIRSGRVRLPHPSPLLLLQCLYKAHKACVGLAATEKPSSPELRNKVLLLMPLSLWHSP